MRKKFLPVVISGVLLFTMATPYFTYANEKIDQKISDIQKDLDEGKSRQEDINKKLADNEKKQEQEKRTLAQLEADLDETKAAIASLNEQIAQTKNTLEQAKKELEAAEKRVAERDVLLQDRVRLLYEHGKVTYMEVLFQATSFRDFLSRFDAVRAVSERDKELLEANRQDREKIATSKRKIEQSLTSLNELQQEMKAKQRLLAEQEKAHQTKLAALQEEHGVLETISEEEEQAINNLIAQLAQAEAEKEEWKQREAERKRQEEERKKKQEASEAKGGANNGSNNTPPSGSVSAPSSGFTWPVPGYGVSSPFGNRFHPVYKSWRLHAGIDIAAPAGTPIVAAGDGKVVDVRPSSGYGNIIVIYHGNGISTKYAHMPMSSVRVSVGQWVKAGQHIAGVGKEGTATGYHLHFEFLRGGTPINPMQFY